MSNEYDAFDQGVEPGGLRSRREIRLMLCYLLKSINGPARKSLLTKALQEPGIANYFEINQALSELTESGHIVLETIEGEEDFRVTGAGREAAELLETTLTISVREKAVRAALRLMTLQRREKENDIEISKTGAGYKISIDIFSSAAKGENDRLLSLSLYLADAMQAERVKKGFLDDPARLCEAVMTALLEQ